MVLNEEHVVVENLDIFYKVGLGAAHDELVTFNVKGSRLCLPVEAAPAARRCSEIFDNRVPVKFVKVHIRCANSAVPPLIKTGYR